MHDKRYCIYFMTGCQDIQNQNVTVLVDNCKAHNFSTVFLL